MDIRCSKCSEVYYCQGLHWSTSDLSWTQFFDLIRGAGCPCCESNGAQPLTPEARLVQLGRLEEEGLPATLSTAAYRMPQIPYRHSEDLLSEYRAILSVGADLLEGLHGAHWGRLYAFLNKWKGVIQLGGEDDAGDALDPDTIYLNVELPHWVRHQRALDADSDDQDMRLWALRRAFEDFWEREEIQTSPVSYRQQSGRDLLVPIATLWGPHSKKFRPSRADDYLNLEFYPESDEMIEQVQMACTNPDELEEYQAALEEAVEQVDRLKAEAAATEARTLLEAQGAPEMIVNGSLLEMVEGALRDGTEQDAHRIIRLYYEPVGYTYLAGRVNPEAILAVPTLWFDTLEDITGPLRGILLLKGEGPQWVDNLPAGEFVREGSGDVSSRTYMELPPWARVALWEAKGESF